MSQTCLLHLWQIGEKFFDIGHNKYATIWKEALHHMLFFKNKIKEENEGEHCIIVLVSWNTFLQLCGELRPLPHLEIVEDKILFKNQSS